jgi:hypothetical protein
MNAPTDWVSAIAILAAGLILGVILFVFLGKKKSRTLGGDIDLERKDLEAKRDALIQLLRDLETDPKLTPDQLSTERRRLELETANVLRQLDGLAPAPVAEDLAVPAAATTSTSSMNPAVKGFIWGAASFLMLFGLGYFVMKSANPREEGGSVTGGMMGGAQNAGAQQQAAPNDPMVKQLEAAVQQQPENLQLRNDLAQAYLERDYMMGVFEQTKFVLERAPEDSRALTFQALVRMAMGEQVPATEMLQRATKSDPKNLDAWVALAWLYAQSDNMKEAEAMIAQAATVSPADKPKLDDIFQQMKQHVAEAKMAPAAQIPASGELPPGHPPVDGAAPAQAAMPQPGMQRPVVADDGRSVHVTLELAPGAKMRTGVLYVMAKRPQGGPPVAVKRMMATNFPMTFDLGSADSMMGQPLPDSFLLEARLDSDGDAATKPPTDPSASQQNVAPGATVKLSLK